MNVLLYFIPIISAFLGGFFNYSYGKYFLKTYLPNKKQQIASVLSEKVKSLLPLNDIEHQLTHPDLMQKSMPSIEKHIDEFLNIKLPQEIPMLTMFVGNKTIDKIKEVFIDQLLQLFPKVMEEFISNAKDKIDIQSYIIKELNKIEHNQSLKKALSTPLKKFSYTGMFLGFLIGVLNVILFVMLS